MKESRKCESTNARKFKTTNARNHEGTKGQKHECRGEKFFALDRRYENAKPSRGDRCITVCKRSAAYGSRDDNRCITLCKVQPQLRVAAKQTGLRVRHSQFRAFACLRTDRQQTNIQLLQSNNLIKRKKKNKIILFSMGLFFSTFAKY
jgi:hypothetical protein